MTLTRVMGDALDAVLAQARTAATGGGTRAATVDNRTISVAYPFPSPTDWRDCPIYFLLVDRFNRPDAAPRARWDGIYDFGQGGTLKGVQQQLGYLADLGMKAIWLSPVVKNARPETWRYNYHGYGAQNFLAVDDRLGSEQDFEALVTEAHARGLYVILDIVLNHSARVFDYFRHGTTEVTFKDQAVIDGGLGSEPPVRWLNGLGFAREDWQNRLLVPDQLSPDDAVYPVELQNHLFFRRRGEKTTDDPGAMGYVKGDFGAMRQLAVEYDASVAGQEQIRDALGPRPVLNILIRAYAYLMARFDLDGYRIDTVKYVHPDMIQTFGNAMREFALSIGKRNFFTFGEIYDDEATIADFVGRNNANKEGFGIDAALDFPLHYKLPKVVKSLSGAGVEEIRKIFEVRKAHEQELISSHGEAGRYFVSFLDSHDKHERFNHPDMPQSQVAMGLALLFFLQGIPSIYYGTEQGLDGAKDGTGPGAKPQLDRLESVREALWGKQPTAFDADHPLYKTVQALNRARQEHGALRYGRLYFRQLSGNGVDFGHAGGVGGVVAFSRILFDREVVVAANTSTETPFQGHVLVDRDINPAASAFTVAYSNLDNFQEVRVKTLEAVFWEDGRPAGSGPAAVLPLTLSPTEVWLLAPA